MSHLRKPPDVAGERALETTLDKRRRHAGGGKRVPKDLLQLGILKYFEQ